MHSVSRAFANSIIQLAERHRLALPAALVAAVRAAARVPLATQDALWSAYCGAGGPPLPGLRLGLALQLAHLDSAGLQLACSETLGEALAGLQAVAPAIGEGGGFTLERAGSHVHLVYRPRLAVCAEQRVEAALAGALNVARWVTGGRFAPAGLWFSHPPLAAPEAYEALLDLPVSFGAERDSLSFDAEQLALPLVGANAELREHLQALTARTLAALGREGPAAAAQRLVREHPDWGRERIAAALGSSGRHLVRRLAREGLSFKAVRDAVLDELACRALAGPRRLADIAADLGFADEGSFVRAFRRWRGTTPARWRAEAHPMHPLHSVHPVQSPGALRLRAKPSPPR